MKLKKVFVHASQALCAMIVLSFLVAGCEKKKEVLYPAEGHAYMNDPVFRQQLEKQDKVRNRILGEREKLIKEFEKLEKRAGSREAAEKLPAWAALLKRAEACGRAFESNRWQTAELIRERMRRAEADSARVRGERKKEEVKTNVKCRM